MVASVYIERTSVGEGPFEAEGEARVVARVAFDGANDVDAPVPWIVELADNLTEEAMEELEDVAIDELAVEADEVGMALDGRLSALMISAACMGMSAYSFEIAQQSRNPTFSATPYTTACK